MTQIRQMELHPLAAALALALLLPVGAAKAAEADAGAATAMGSDITRAAGPLLAAASKLDRVQVRGVAQPGPASPKLTEPLIDTPKTITIVPAELLQDQGVTTLREALGNVPGISLQAGEGGVPAGDNLTLRGFSARTDLFVDGVRDFGGYARDPFNVEQIEVIKGPASSQTGRGSTGGSINLVSKTAHNETFRRATISAGGEDLLRLSADLNQPLTDDSALRINALAHDGGVVGRDAVESERWAIAPTLAFGLGDAELDFSLFHLRQDNVPDYGQPWVPAANTALPLSRDARSPVDRENWYGLLDRDYEETDTDLATLSVELPLGESTTLHNLSRWGESRRDSIVTAPRFRANDSTDIRRTAKTRDSEDTILLNATDLVSRVATGSVEHTLVAGVEIAREESENRARTATDGDLADLFDPDFRAPYTGVVSPDPLRDANAEADSLAVYLFDTAVLSPNWEVSGGLRWDRFDVDTEGYDSTIASRAQYSRRDSMLSGRVALLYKPHEDASLYVGVGNSFNPSAEGLTLNSEIAGLEPEKSRSLELGGKWNLFDGDLLLTGALFRTEKINARTEDTDQIVVLEGEQQVDGIEFGATGRIGDRWTLFGGYVYLDSEVTESLNAAERGNRLGNTPRHSASVWTTFDASDRLQFGVGGRHVGARYSNTQNTREAKAYTVYDAMAAYTFNDSARLRVNGYNLSDKDYIETVGGGHYTPGAGRSWMASLDLSF